MEAEGAGPFLQRVVPSVRGSGRTEVGMGQWCRSGVVGVGRWGSLV